MKTKSSLVLIVGMSLAPATFLHAGVTKLNASGAFYADSTNSGIPKRVEIGTTKINESSLITTYLGATAVCDFNGVRVGKGNGDIPQNTAIGASALNGVWTAAGGSVTGNWVTGVGSNALQSNSTGDQNTAIGHAALQLNNAGSQNTASGVGVLRGNTTGSFNTGDGVDSMVSNTTGNYNTAIGQKALYYNTTGSNNAAVGIQALQYNQSFSNTGIGVNALVYNTSGSQNVAIGTNAATKQRDGLAELSITSGSIYIGAECRGMSNADYNSIVIGTSAWGEGANTTVIGNGATISTHLYGKTVTDSLQVFGNTVIGGNTVLSGTVVLAQPQGDISMGAYQ